MGAGDIGVLLITHGRQGICLLESASHLLNETLQGVSAVDLVGTERRSEIEKRCLAGVAALRESGYEVLILTDLAGSTHASIVDDIASDDEQIACAHGVNLMMLIEAVAQRKLPLQELQKQVVLSARHSVVLGKKVKKKKDKAKNKEEND